MSYTDESIIIFLREMAEKKFSQKKEEYTKKFLKEWEIYKEKINTEKINTEKINTEKINTEKINTEKMASKKTASKPKVKVVFEEEEENTGCPHILTSGKNQGSSCGVKKVLENGFCNRHKDSNVLNKTQADKIIKKHPALKGYWWNSKNKIVFEKKDNDFLAIGTTTKITQGQACRIIDLTEEDIQKCKKLNYKINTVKAKSAKQKEKALSEGEDDILIIEGDNIKLAPPEEVLESPDEIAKEVSRILLGDIDDILLDVKTGENKEDEESQEEESQEEESQEEERNITEWINTVIEECETWDITENSYDLIDSIQKLHKKVNLITN
jgi:hypothetical protein